MNAESFFNTLEDSKEKELIFLFEGEQIKKGYHVTEFKSIKVESVDCGGKSNNWNELVLHITAAKQAGESFMTVKKFLEIYTLVSNKITSHNHALMRAEYAQDNGVAINYIVDELEECKNAVLVKSLAPGVTCKAKDFVTKDVPLSTITDLGCC